MLLRYLYCDNAGIIMASVDTPGLPVKLAVSKTIRNAFIIETLREAAGVELEAATSCVNMEFKSTRNGKFRQVGSHIRQAQCIAIFFGSRALSVIFL